MLLTIIFDLPENHLVPERTIDLKLWDSLRISIPPISIILPGKVSRILEDH